MELLIPFIIKAIDNALGSAKTIFMAKEKYFLGAIFNAGSFFFYSVALVQMIKSDSYSYILMMCLAVFIGTYIPGILVKKSERDKLYIYEITAPDVATGKTFADIIRRKNIAVKTSFAYDTKLNEVLCINVYCNTKEESKKVDSLIQPNFKYHKYEPKE